MEEMKNERYERVDEGEIDLLQVISGMVQHLRRLWWLCVILTMAGAAVAVAVLFYARTPMYQSSASFTVATGGESGSYSFYYDSSTADQLSMTFPYILESSYFRSMLLGRLGTNQLNGTITAETISSSNVVTMKVQSSSPQDAYSILTAAIEIYPQAAHFVLGDISFSMLTQPQLPTEPFNRPSVEKSCLIGSGLGLLLSLGILLVLSMFRKNVCEKEDMRKITSMRCLAILPRIPMKARTRKNAAQVSFRNPALPHGYTESIRMLKNRVVKAMDANEENVLLVTSTVAGEGKSVTAVNLAGQLAMDGARVLLIDGDLRKQQDNQLLDLAADYGLMEACEEDDERTIWSGIERNSAELGENGLMFLGGSKPLHQPASLLSSPAFKRCIQALQKRVDYIIIDCPPCGMFQDTGILTEFAQSVLYVVGYDRLPAGTIRDGIYGLGGQHISFLGYVFNNCPETKGGYGYGYGRYGYGRYGGYGYGRSDYDLEKENIQRR